MKSEKLSKLSWYKLFFVIFFLTTVFQPVLTLYQERDVFFSRGYTARYHSLKEVYEGSQYVKEKNAGIIPDQALESFAGGVFLKGLDPILIIHDQPPMGRYILSLSILIFDNANTIMIAMFFLSGLGVFLISRLILGNALFSLLPVGIFINEPLFINKFYNSPLLEPIQLPFIIFSLYFFIKGIIEKNYAKWFILTSLMLGFVISIRFFILGAFLVLAMFTYFLIKKQFNKRFAVFLLTLPIVIIILLISYTRTIQLGSPILHIFGIQKYIYYYHKTQLSLPFSFWDLLLFNKWHTWWGTRSITSDSQWIIVWPISALFTLGFSILGLLKKIPVSEPEKIIIIWIALYSLFLSLGQTSTRYFTPLLPFIYIIATSLLIKIFTVKLKTLIN